MAVLGILLIFFQFIEKCLSESTTFKSASPISYLYSAQSCHLAYTHVLMDFCNTTEGF